MTEGDVDTGNFFVLQNIADHVSARGICADCEFADAVAILVRAGVSAKFFQQFLVFAGKIDNAIVAHLDAQRRLPQIAIFAAQIIANHPVDDENPVAVRRCSENFAPRKIAPFCGSNDPAGLEPF